MVVYIVMILVGLNIASELRSFNQNLTDFRGKVVFDIDKVRKSLLDEMEYMYVAGCRVGIDYPEEYRKPGDYFNQNSPSIYCTKKREILNDYIYDRVKEIGR